MNILLVDDHALFRAGLRMLLAGIYADACVMEAPSVADALAIAGLHPGLDLCLLDLGFKHESGLAALAQFKSVAPHCAMVVVSATDDGATIRACLDRGAMGFIPKSLEPAVLVGALRTVLAGTVYLPEQIQSAVHDTDTLPVLTPRQRDVLRCLGRALPAKLIARELELSEHTVKEHTALLYQALGVHSRTEAVIMANRLRLFDEPTD